MGGRVIASVDGGLAVVDPSDGRQTDQISIAGAGALCSTRDAVFCAGDGGLIWRLHSQSLVPQALFSGGPGVCAMCPGGDGERLYVLCAEGDSVLMCCARTGRPLLLNRAGVNPQGMAFSSDGETLLVAGGESAQVLVYCPRTLCLLRTLSAPGIVYAAAAQGDSVYALCMDETLCAVLAAFRPDGKRCCLRLGGLPGTLLSEHGRLIASTEGMLHTLSAFGARVHRVQRVPGRAKRLLQSGGRRFMLDGTGERLYMHRDGGWRCVASGVRDAICCGDGT